MYLKSDVSIIKAWELAAAISGTTLNNLLIDMFIYQRKYANLIQYKCAN